MAQVYITSNKPSEKKIVKRNMLIVTNTVAHYSHLKNTMYYVSISKEKKKKKEYYVSSLQKVYSFLQQKQYLSFCNGFFFLFLYICTINK